MATDKVSKIKTLILDIGNDKTLPGNEKKRIMDELNKVLEKLKKNKTPYLNHLRVMMDSTSGLIKQLEQADYKFPPNVKAQADIIGIKADLEAFKAELMDIIAPFEE